MRVLLIGYVWPEPGSSAAGWRTLALMESFVQRGDQVTFACAAGISEHAADLTKLGIDSVSIALNCESFDQFVATLNPELVVYDRFVCEEQFGWRVDKACPDAIRVLDTQDLHCLRDARERLVKAGGEPCRVGWTELDLESDLAIRELAAIWRCDLTLVISRYELELLRSRFSVDDSLLHYFPLLCNNVDADAPDFASRKDCLVLGNFRHAPNWDALQYLRHDIWPQVRRSLPCVSCLVYGAYPPPKAQQLHNEKLGFLIKGWAKSSAEVMRRARLNLAPLRFGAGQKGKLLEAMQHGTPSVTTGIGAEGMAGDAPWPGRVVDSPADFADAVVALYDDPSEWQEAQDRGYALVREAFLAKPHQSALVTRLDELAQTLDQHRSDNFTGRMLRHQSLRSQHYMSLWIEVKNKLKTAI